MWNNDTDQFEDDGWIDDAAWYDDEMGNLYIVPNPGIVADCVGPDNATMDAINACCRDHEELTDEDIERLRLTPVSRILRRFSEEDGYYHA